ncbi:MucR family transcriptional regulator [Kaistia granuli]|uniref:MucR family transcriptional regulator n=1 Tax=Kaistia granuli TaxID=363259 RepID=UPI000362A119
MTDTQKPDDNHFMYLTADIVASYVAHNFVSQVDLAALIGNVHATFEGLSDDAEPAPVELTPAVAIKKSVTPDFIICLEDGKKFKTLKRHLQVHFGLTPEQYRAKWNLPADYPMVAPGYSAARSALSKSLGFGKRPGIAPGAGAAAKGAAQSSSDNS